MSKAVDKSGISFVRVPPPSIQLVIPAAKKAGVVRCIDAIKGLFGPGGKNWVKYAEHVHYEKGDYDYDKGKNISRTFDGFCLIGGVKRENGPYEGAARAAISMAIIELYPERQDGVNIWKGKLDESVSSAQVVNAETITSFNDSDKTKWSDIKAVLARAKKLVQNAATR